jgi:hypothetical protein
LRASYVPFFYARWDAETQKHALLSQERASMVEANFIVDGMFTPEESRGALHEMAAPVLILIGE